MDEESKHNPLTGIMPMRLMVQTDDHANEAVMRPHQLGYEDLYRPGR